MKKLLSILAATTMVVSAPLSVVACGDGTGKPDKDWDFDSTAIDFKREIGRVYQTSLTRDFQDYFFTNQEDIEKENIFESISLSKLDEIVGDNSFVNLNTDSKDFKNFASDLEKLTNFDNLKKETDKEIVKNVNYKPMLVDGANPFDNSKIDFTTITVQKLDNEIFTIHFKTISDFYFKDKSNQKVNDTVTYQSSITIFKERNTSEEMKLISKSFENKIKSKEYANSFNFESEDGRIYKNIDNLDKNSNVKNQFLTAGGEVLKENNEWKEYSFKADNMNIKGSVEDFDLTNTHNSRDYIPYNSVPQLGLVMVDNPESMDPGVLGFMEKMQSDEIPESYFKSMATSFDASKKNTGDWDQLKSGDWSYAPELDNDLSDKGWSRAFNPFLDKKYSKVLTDLSSISPNFALDQNKEISENKDSKLMGIYKVETSGLILNYYNSFTGNTIDLQMPKIQIGIRQNAPETTKKIVEDFFAANVNLFKQMYGYNGSGSTTTNFFIEMPNSLGSLKRDTFYTFGEVFNPAYEQARKKVISKNSNYEKYLTSFASFGAGSGNECEYIKIDNNNVMSFYDANKLPHKTYGPYFPWICSPGSYFFSKDSYGVKSGLGGQWNFGFSMPLISIRDIKLIPNYKPVKAVFVD
ncbi:hypothetical protein SSABA_v1c09300 [Spiroplasma sabaudiense Ar-1343]|uniref:Lipoprotein n=1 Tax=Spiroplasma sabaudiense Ar-1343 TaxID=1276257 RepID=W6AAX7_9MOLU|nr:lipoprotein [Spiroplasma sabaudiense]AHI54328.1 hypothetical protein SSABA_v1c09300 [Spiroplasma sabaudiense Ar-1343]